MDGIVYLNGEYLSVAQAKVSVLDRGFLLADGVYEVITIYNGRPFAFSQHLERFRRSLEAIDLVIPYSDADLEAICHQLIERNPLQPIQTLYLQATRGVSAERHHHFESYTPTIFAKLQTINPKRFAQGVKAITVEEIRWKRCDIKCINRLPNVLMAQQAHQAQAEEAIIVDDNRVVEGSGSNVFIVEDEVVITSPKSPHILSGITREVVLELASSFTKTQEAMISLERLQTAQEVWLTSSSLEVTPVIQLNDLAIADGKPGKLYKQIYQAYRQRVDSLLS